MQSYLFDALRPEQPLLTGDCERTEADAKEAFSIASHNLSTCRRTLRPLASPDSLVRIPVVTYISAYRLPSLLPT
jgi:hypothetical protein